MTETYTRDSDGKKFRVAGRLSLQNLALVIEPIEETPMPDRRTERDKIIDNVLVIFDEWHSGAYHIGQDFISELEKIREAKK